MRVLAGKDEDMLVRDLEAGWAKRVSVGPGRRQVVTGTSLKHVDSTDGQLAGCESPDGDLISGGTHHHADMSIQALRHPGRDGASGNEDGLDPRASCGRTTWSSRSAQGWSRRPGDQSRWMAVPRSPILIGVGLLLAACTTMQEVRVHGGLRENVAAGERVEIVTRGGALVSGTVDAVEAEALVVDGRRVPRADMASLQVVEVSGSRTAGAVGGGIGAFLLGTVAAIALIVLIAA